MMLAHAHARFGLGARPGDLDEKIDPRDWVERQLAAAPALPAALTGLPGSRDNLAAVLEARRAGDAGATQKIGAMVREQFLPQFIREAALRTRVAVTSDTPLVERLVQFWSNHFTVSVVNRPIVVGIANAYEREAIRPHLLGRFRDLLEAAVLHPAMLAYLDNAQSIGPNSLAGKRRERGLNENLGRELLELHTLGVKGGYSQADVTEMARVLTGWTYGGGRLNDTPGRTAFIGRMHEPGAKSILGKRYAEEGENEVRRVLDDLARHPATAQHIATKLVRHFIADAPPEAAVKEVAAVFRKSDGDLRLTLRAVAARPEAWEPPLAKVKTPNELAISAWRALGSAPAEDRALVGQLRALEQAPFGAPSPAGWSDEGSQWVGPEAMVKRVEWATQMARRVPGGGRDPSDIADAVLGDLLRADTRQSIARAASAKEGFTLLLAAPEFQRR